MAGRSSSGVGRSSMAAAPPASRPTSPSRATGSRPSAPGLEGPAARLIDATGHVVTPGFIDAHSHSDLFYFACPRRSRRSVRAAPPRWSACARSPRRPSRPGARQAVRDWAGGIGASVDFHWETFAEYLDALRARKPSINIAQFVGHGALRLAAVGAENRPVSPDDMRAMAAPARRGSGRRRVWLLDGAGLSAERLQRDPGADRARPLDGPARWPLLLPRARRERDGGGLHPRGHPHRRGRRRRRADRPRQGGRARELGKDGSRPAAHRRGARAGRRRERRRLSLSRRQHQDGQPHALVGPRRGHPETAGAPGRPDDAPAHHRGMPRRRRALADDLAGRRRASTRS